MNTLERIAETLKSTGEEIEIPTPNTIYINFDFSEAMVIEPTENDNEFVIVVMAWDRTHGVSAEKEIAVCSEDEILSKVQAFLAEDKKNKDELDRLMGEGE